MLSYDSERKQTKILSNKGFWLRPHKEDPTPKQKHFYPSCQTDKGFRGYSRQEVGVPRRTPAPTGFETDRGSIARPRPPPRAKARQQPQSLGTRARAPHPCGLEVAEADQCGGGRSPTSGSGAPPEVQRRRGNLGKRKASFSQSSDIF